MMSRIKFKVVFMIKKENRLQKAKTRCYLASILDERIFRQLLCLYVRINHTHQDNGKEHLKTGSNSESANSSKEQDITCRLISVHSILLDNYQEQGEQCHILSSYLADTTSENNPNPCLNKDGEGSLGLPHSEENLKISNFAYIGRFLLSHNSCNCPLITLLLTDFKSPYYTGKYDRIVKQ